MSVQKAKGTFVVTGAGRGLGASLAVAAANDGYNVAILSRTESDLLKVKNQIDSQKQNCKCTIHVCDLTNESEVNSAFIDIKKEHESITVLVNNAATWTGGKTVEELSTDDLKNSLDLNFYSAFLPTQASLKIWRERKSDDLCIINIGATASKRGGNKTAAFAIAKSSLRILSESLAKELGKEGVHVGHLIIDGLIANERTKKLNPNTSADSFIPPESIANTIINVANQDRGCWTFEWEVRPYNEKW